jgi:hypothetical protein
LYELYSEKVERYVEEERPTVLSASASQAMMEKPSHFSSFDSENRNDAHVQSELLLSLKRENISSSFLLTFFYFHIDNSNVSSTTSSIVMILIVNLIQLTLRQ